VYASGDGAGVFLSIFSGDIVARLNASFNAAFGEPGTESGGSARVVWRHPTPWIEVGGFGFTHRPSRGRFAQAPDSLDADLFHGAVALSGERRGDGLYLRARGGLGAGTLQPVRGPGTFRGLGFAELDLRLSQSRGARGLVERVRLHAAQGHTGGHYTRAIGTFELHTTGRDMLPMQLGATLGRLGGAPHPFEWFAIGGPASPVADSSLVGQRYHMPMFPTAIAMGRDLFAWRAALPTTVWTLFYEGASVSPDAFSERRWHRAAGLEFRYAMPPVPAAFAPSVDLRAGGAYLLDDPFRNRVRLFIEMRIEP
jgi:hypothetical protein